MSSLSTSASTSAETTSFATSGTTSFSSTQSAATTPTDNTSSTGSETLSSTTSRSISETSSVYIDTSYTYSPTSFLPSPSPTTTFNFPLTSLFSSRPSEAPFPHVRPSSTVSSSSAAAPSETLKPIVPSAGQPLLQGTNGLLLNLTLGGDDVGQAVYSVPMVFGHPSGVYGWTTRRKRGRERGKRAAGTYQSMNLQVDLGSSDLWVAATTCQTSDCRGSGVQKLNAGNSIDAGTYVNLTYQSGHAAGEVYWDEMQIGVTIPQIESAVNGTGGGGSNGFDVAYQAFIAANEVSNEDLSGGGFSGVLGLALPANSVILSQLGGSTSGAPDGAPFLDNLFGSGVNAPQGRYFSLSLERVGDSRTKSSLGIGMFDGSLCAAPCLPNYSSIVTSSAGPLYWRIPLQGITAFTWASGQAPSNTSSTATTIKLPSSSTTTGQSYPVAVLDSGGYQVLMGDKSVVDAIYAVFGGTQASDGNYYVRCDMPLSLAFTFNGKQYPVHPLDMSDYSTTDSSHKTCVGLIQYASGLTAGDVVLGVSYLKNVYSIYTYPSSSASTSSWLPMVGMVSLTNVTESAQEFYDVRVQHSTYPGQVTPTGNTATQSADAAASQAGHQVLNGGIIALAVVLGFLGIAAALFCAWFFWLRKKYGTKGVPVFAGRRRKGPHGSVDGTEGSIGGTDHLEMAAAGGLNARRSKKYRNMQRQKSMIDGFMDFDTDLWSDDVDSRTDADTATSRSMDGAGVPILGEELARGRGTSSKAWESSYPPVGWTSHQRTPSSPRQQERSPPPTSPLSVAGDPMRGPPRSRSSQRFADADEGPYPTFSSVARDPAMSPSREPLMPGQPETPTDTLRRQDSNVYSDGVHGSERDVATTRPFSSRGSILRIHDPMEQKNAG